MAFSQSLKILCLFLVIGISLAHNKPAPPMPPPPMDDNNYCKDTYPECPTYCPAIYDPVCAKYQVRCDASYCPPVFITYPSACVACQDKNVISYRYGTCEECGEEYEEEEEEECEEEEEEVEEECEEEEEEEEECEEEEEVEEEECEEEEEKHMCKKVHPGKKVACTMEYLPVCGYFNGCPNGVCFETFPNSCVACYFGCADYYIDGECPKY